MPPRPEIEASLLLNAETGRAGALKLVALCPDVVSDSGDLALFDLDKLEPELARIAAMGAEGIRLYEPPDVALLDLCERYGLGVFAGLNWGWHRPEFSLSAAWRKAVGAHLQARVRPVAGHPALWAWVLGNELDAALVRRLGWRGVQGFLEQGLEKIAEVDGQSWRCYASYPPTLPLIPRNADLSLVNVYLESEQKLAAYLPTLQAWAGGRPLILGEWGLDVQRHGERAQADLMLAGWRQVQEQGLAGLTLFAWSDRWVRAGEEVRGWSFGLTDWEGAPRPALASMAASWQGEELLSLAERECAGEGERLPMVSVLICTHRGAGRIRLTLEALKAQSLAEFEVIVLDDGGEPALRELLEELADLNERGEGSLRFGVALKLVVQEHAGLSAARNRAAREARGEILAYLDDDSEPQREFLERMVRGMEAQRWDAASGLVQAPVEFAARRPRLAEAPGQAQPVLLGDGRVEHIPGCSFVVRKRALEWLGGWDEQYWRAGDDVDFCWRLQELGLRVGFVADAVMFHRPRESWRGYLAQQVGYGEAEWMLARKWPERATKGGLRWQGVVYGRGALPADLRVEGEEFPQIYGHGKIVRGLSWEALIGWAQRLARRWGRRKAARRGA